jgi:transposase
MQPFRSRAMLTGIPALAAHLASFSVALVVLEATGGFEVEVAAALAGAGLPVAVVNPRHVRDFARAAGQLAKTDQLDARVIALFAERMRPEARPVPDEKAKALQNSSPADDSWWR